MSFNKLRLIIGYRQALQYSCLLHTSKGQKLVIRKSL
jgi:hypothetical protein